MGKIPKRKQVPFELCSDFEPMGDQPQAIAQINENLNAKVPFQVLLGVTGSGKTFTIAQVIAKQNRPCLVLAPNKTLAAQLYTEFRELFPKNQVRYFVSYYDYYQPEAFIPSTNTYIEKDAAINDEIDKMRHAATKSLLESRDTIIVASISCIYGIGAPEKYFEMMLFIEVGQTISREELIQNLVRLQFVRADEDFRRGSFRVKGEVVDIFPSDEDARAIRIIFFGDEIEEIREIDSITSTTLQKTSSAAIYPTSHYVTDQEALERARKTIKKELKVRLAELRNAGKVL
ncbi:MAG: DEAD/DEAH box helicase family protein, partial [Bdellovibrionales bacterium]|nr:DEAD/DEAH box helicase family protein [Bdellovibrionales bacterium]